MLKLLSIQAYEKPIPAFLGEHAFIQEMTPWGPTVNATLYAPGLILYETDEGNGFHLSQALNEKIHPLLRREDSWYEEGADWSIVVFSFPQFFKREDVENALKDIKEVYPIEYERITGQPVSPGESYLKDKLEFKRENRHKWVVVTALNSPSNPNYVECGAMRGGDFKKMGYPGHEMRYFLVSQDEYREGKGLFGLVIDPSKHIRLVRPSKLEESL